MNLQLPPERPLPNPDRMVDQILDTERERLTAPARRGPWLALAAAAALAGIVVGVLLTNGGPLGRGPVGLPPTVNRSASPVATPTASRVVTPVPRPTPVATTPSSSPLTGGSLALGETAVFEHFEVTVAQVDSYVDRSAAEVKVCVRSLPPDPTGDTTRVSIDPWRVLAGPTELPARAPRRPSPADYPVETFLRVGECAEGTIEFPAPDPGLRLRAVRYLNFLGDRAEWPVSR